MTEPTKLTPAMDGARDGEGPRPPMTTMPHHLRWWAPALREVWAARPCGEAAG